MKRIPKPCLLFALVTASVKETTSFVSLPSTPSLGVWLPQKACVHPGHLRAAPAPVSCLQPETSNYLWGGHCTQEPSHLARCAGQAHPSLNDTLLACPLCWSRRGGGPAQPELWFLFPLRQVTGSGPPTRPVLGWHRGAHSNQARPNSGHHVLPVSGTQRLPARG